MTTSIENNQQLESERGLRYYLGIILFVLSFLLPILALLIVPILGVSPGISNVLYSLSVIGGPDLFLIGAAALLGKENLLYLFSKLGNRFKKLIKWDQVTRARYRVGVWIFMISVLTSLVLFYIFPESLQVGDQPGWGFYVTVGADFLFIISFFVLGAEFWAKLGALFQYDAGVVIDQKHSE